MTKSAIETRTALITGASAGIGRDYARFLAARGYNLILTARRGDLLETLGSELSAAFGTSVYCFPDDLADPAAPARLAAKIKNAGLQVDYLVNNAGYSVPGFFKDVRWEAQRDMMQVMVNSVVELSHLMGNDMVKRGYGRIVNIASMAAYLNGSAGSTLYSATKAFVLRFSQSLAIEYRGTGVQVVVTCPGFTRSDFHDVAGNREKMDKLPGILWLDGPRVVREAHEAVEIDKGPIVITGWVYKILGFIFRLLPENIMNRRASQDSRNSDVRAEDKITKNKTVAKAAAKKAPAPKTASAKVAPKAGSEKTSSEKTSSEKTRNEKASSEKTSSEKTRTKNDR